MENIDIDGKFMWQKCKKWEKLLELKVEMDLRYGATHLRTASQLNQQTQMSRLSWLRAI